MPPGSRPIPRNIKRKSSVLFKSPLRKTPRILLFQPYLDVAMQKNVTGYRYWFHRQLDYRQLAKV